jgi:two-component system alkaline phosphatase synthesis response regulator PhoP
VVLDIDERMAYVAGVRTELTFSEFEMLHRLMRDPGRVLRRNELQSSLAPAGERSERAVDVRIARLRRKLRAAHYLEIETVWNVGYRCFVSSAVKSGATRELSGAAS